MHSVAGDYLLKQLCCCACGLSSFWCYIGFRLQWSASSRFINSSALICTKSHSDLLTRDYSAFKNTSIYIYIFFLTWEENIMQPILFVFWMLPFGKHSEEMKGNRMWHMDDGWFHLKNDSQLSSVDKWKERVWLAHRTKWVKLYEGCKGKGQSSFVHLLRGTQPK